jgi:predicted DNA-binding protein (MmcQ/YjbR family)
MAARKKPAGAKKAASPREAAIAFALSLPEAWEDHPWGESVAKVGKKVFVFFGILSESVAFALCVKLPESAPEVLELPNAEPAGYGLGKSGWVLLRYAPGEAVPLDNVREWIVESYRAVAPKKLLKQLDGE